MKKHIIRIFSAVIIVCLLISFAVFSMNAEESTGTINDNLVAYWNFEGEGDAALEDKASANGSNNLIKNGNVVIANGTATVPEEGGAFLQATNLTDFSSGTQATVYMRVKITGEASSYASMFYASGSMRVFARQWQTTDRIIAASGGHNPRVEENLGVNDQGQWNDGNWIHIAFAVNVDGVGNQNILYVSADGETWRLAKTDPAGTALNSIAERINKADAVLLFGKANVTDAQTAGFEYDDIRIYNKALTYDEVRLIQPNTIELKQETEESTESTEATEAPTIPALTEAPDHGKDSESVATESESAASEQSTTVATSSEEKSGCSSTFAIGVPAVIGIAGAAILRKKKKDKQ